MVRYLFYTIGDLTYQSPLVLLCTLNTLKVKTCSWNSSNNVLYKIYFVDLVSSSTVVATHVTDVSLN